MLSAALIATAALAGLAGSWSPCGLSAIETLNRQRVATATFATGALAGGVATFGGLALLGTTLFGPVIALALAALVLAALGDAAGRRVVPQVRRQVPESWRRVLPVPLAAGLYGVLLGLGFTTFLLTFATWALAAACLAVGTPQTGALVGLAFGAGRALPVAVLSLREDGAALLGERPGLLRGLRGAVATALVAAAGTLVLAPPAARAAAVLAEDARDPSAAPGLLAYQPRQGNGVLVRDGRPVRLPGTHPVVSPERVAWIAGERIVVADAGTLEPLLRVDAPGADAIALSTTHLAWRVGRRLLTVPLVSPALPPFEAASATGRDTIGRPSLAGAQLVYDRQSPRRSRILSTDLDTGLTRALRESTAAQLLQPTRAEGRLLYVRATARRQELVLGRGAVFSTTPTARRDSGHERGLEDHREGYRRRRRPPKPARPPVGLTVTLWTTALSGRAAYVTRLRHLDGGGVESRILRVEL